MEKLCDQLFSQVAEANDAAMWSGTESDSQPPTEQVPLPVTQPDVRRKPIKLRDHRRKGMIRGDYQQTSAGLVDADESFAPRQKNRPGHSSGTRKSKKRFFSPPLLASLLFGFGLLAIGLMGTDKPERSAVASIDTLTTPAAGTSHADTSHLSSQPVPATQSGKYITCEIRNLPVVTWILAENPETEGNLGIDYSLLDPANLCILRIRMVKPDGSLLHIQTLQTLLEMEDSKATQGSYIDLDYPELGISGQGEILEIQPCPRIPPRPSAKHCLVTTKFEHEAATVVDLHIEGMPDGIGVTTNHPFWSEDRQEFVQAGNLHVGETLLTAADTTTHVDAITQRRGRHTVYNLEVDGEHVYYVSASGVLVHNSQKYSKPINLPSAKTIQIDMQHIASGHMKGGSRVSPKKDLFPESWSQSQVEQAVRDAYKSAKRVQTQGDRVIVRGTTSNGMTIEMWINKVRKTIETAYPVT
jgi:hypothetical protein